MLVVVPMSANQEIHYLISDSLKSQTMDLDVRTVVNSVIHDKSKTNDGYKSRLNVIAQSRNMCRSLLAEEEISVMNDSTVGHTCDTNLQEMYDLLMENTDVVAVALPLIARSWIPLESNHIQNGCIMARKVVWQNIDFNARKDLECTCAAFCRGARKLGHYRFLDMNDRAFKVKNGRVIKYTNKG